LTYQTPLEVAGFEIREKEKPIKANFPLSFM